jgi:hypothetical protein
MEQSLTSFYSVKRFYSARHLAPHDPSLNNRRSRFCINPAKTSQLQKKIERKVADREDLLFNLVSLYKKDDDKKGRLTREERLRKTTTPLEERTNMNVYYWYYNDLNDIERFQDERERMSKDKKHTQSVSLFTDSVQSFSDLTKSLSSQFQDTSQIMSAKRPSKVKKNLRTLSSRPNKLQFEDQKPPTPVDQQTTELIDILNDRDCQLIDDENTQRFLLNSAAIRHMPLDKRFHNEAKGMIFVPKSKSFYPRTVDHLLKSHI